MSKKVAIFNDTSIAKKRHLGCDLVMRNLNYGLQSQGLQPAFHWPVGIDWRAFRHLLPEPGSIDAVVVNGEGSIHHDQHRPRANYLAELGELATNYFQVPAVLVNASLHQNSSGLYRKLAKYDQVYVRDRMSVGECLQNNITADIVPDLTMSRSFDVIRPERNGVGVTDSCFLKVSSQLKAIARKTKSDYFPMENRRLKKFLQPIKGVESHFTDPRFMDARRSIYSCQSVDFFLSWLLSKNVVVTGRYHTVTLCLLTKTPFVAVESNTPKISSLVAEVFGSNNRVAKSVDKAFMLARNEMQSFNEDEAGRLGEFLKHAKVGAAEMYRRIEAAI